MNARRRFLEVPDPRARDVVDEVARLARQDRRAQGAVLATFRPWPGNLSWLVLAALLLPMAAYAATAAPDWEELLVRATITAIAACSAAVFVVPSLFDRHRVCEHGLVLGFRGRSRYVVPWSTLDPGRVRVVHRAPLIGRHRDESPSSPHYRTGLLTTRALAVNGLDTAGAHRSPFTWWVLGTRRPQRLAEAIEAAMVADGYAAQGLAERARRQAVVARWGRPAREPLPERAATDPVLGVDGPPLP
ncbi:hypothetical protein [Kineococcus sp. G2]|uniref:hypothetical protein n=1 Tax=Kineococcus sp. G2 TaxID=3127484 RepID=UPI00301BD116